MVSIFFEISNSDALSRSNSFYSIFYFSFSIFICYSYSSVPFFSITSWSCYYFLITPLGFCYFLITSLGFYSSTSVSFFFLINSFCFFYFLYYFSAKIYFYAFLTRIDRCYWSEVNKLQIWFATIGFALRWWWPIIKFREWSCWEGWSSIWRFSSIFSTIIKHEITISSWSWTVFIRYMSICWLHFDNWCKE